LRISVWQRGRIVQRGGERPDARVLVGQRKARFALVRRDQVETLEFGDVAPAARHLAVGHLVAPRRDRLGERRNGAAVEDAVPEIAEDHRVGRQLADRGGEFADDVVEIARLSSVSILSRR
jgi:hypothetical protein